MAQHLVEIRIEPHEGRWRVRLRENTHPATTYARGDLGHCIRRGNQLENFFGRAGWHQADDAYLFTAEEFSPAPTPGSTLSEELFA